MTHTPDSKLLTFLRVIRNLAGWMGFALGTQGCGSLGQAPSGDWGVDAGSVLGPGPAAAAGTGGDSGIGSPTGTTLGPASTPDGQGVGTGSATATAGGTIATGAPLSSASGLGTLPSFACDDGARPPEAALRRLTMQEYRHTVRDLVAWASDNDEDAAESLGGILEVLPQDHREPVPEAIHGSYRRLDQTVQQAHVDALYTVGKRIGSLLTSSERLRTVVGACASDEEAENDASCLEDFIRRFGQRALRRELDDEEVTFYQSVYGDDPAIDAAAYADVIAVMLNAPQFVYFVEHGSDEVPLQAGVFEVSASELASRLSFQLWQTAPDSELALAGADGSLLQADVLTAQVQRMLTDPRARATARDFVADWLKVEDLPALDGNTQDPVFQEFAGDVHADAQLRQAMVDDVISMVDYYLWTSPADVGTLLTSDASFAQDEGLAQIYGLPAWDGISPPPTFAAGDRPGLFTRALFLSTGTANTRPIMKGVFLRKEVLCDPIPAPPAGANANVPELRSDMTTREVVEEITEVPGSNCAGCHTLMINPLGFATENFDALGRKRAEQRLFDEAGVELAGKAVNTSVVPHVVLGDVTPAAGPAELMRLIAESGKTEACLARHFFRFTFARWEQDATDGCALEAMRQALADRGDLVNILSAAVASPLFKRRAFE